MPKIQELYELRQHPNVRKQLKSIPGENRIVFVDAIGHRGKIYR